MSARIQSQNPLSVFTLATRWHFISQLESPSVRCWLWSVWQSVWVVRLFFPQDSLTNKPSPGGINASHRRRGTVFPGRRLCLAWCVIISFWSPSQKHFPPCCHLYTSLSLSKWVLKSRVKMTCHMKSEWVRDLRSHGQNDSRGQGHWWWGTSVTECFSGDVFLPRQSLLA